MAQAGVPGRTTGSFHLGAMLGTKAGLLKAAEEGDPDAMVRVGDAYYHGSKDFPLERGYASLWFERAAEAGNSEGMFRFAEILRWGEGRLQNVREAETWYRRAAELGHKKARTWLIHAYETGDGTERNASEATRHILDQGQAPAVRMTGLWIAAAVALAGLAILFWRG
jgi:TPR repeat protein